MSESEWQQAAEDMQRTFDEVGKAAGCVFDDMARNSEAVAAEIVSSFRRLTKQTS